MPPTPIVPTDSAAPAAGRLRVLIVDDDALERELYRDYLGDGGRFEIVEVGDGAQALERCGSGRHDCVLLDHSLPDASGLDMIAAIRERTDDRTPIVFVTGVGSERIATDALKAGAADYLAKNDVTVDSLRRAIEGAVEKVRLRRELDAKVRRIAEQNVELQKGRDEIRRFYQNVSHELATPLTSMQEFADILLDGLAGDLADEQREYVGFIRTGCAELSDGVETLMQMSRLENETDALERRAFPIGRTVGRVIERYRDEAAAKAITVRDETPPDLPPALADPDRTERVLANLVCNAIRFTAEGGGISVIARRSLTRAGHVAVAVVDSGCGIEEHELESVFERLYQSDPSVARDGADSATTGLGLGLAIARRLVELQGGRLRVESEIGVGSTFTFSLPAAPDADPDGEDRSGA